MKLTNRQKIESLKDKEFISRVYELGQVPAFEYVDWEKWLNDTDERLPYIGVSGTFKAYDIPETPWKECIILKEHEMFGEPYCYLISDGVALDCPKERVKEII